MTDPILLLSAVTLPVFLGVLLAGALRRRLPAWSGWAGAIVALVITSAWWGLEASASSPFSQRFAAPFAVYAPTLLLGALALHRDQPLRWKHIAGLGAGLAVLNILAAQMIFVGGCTMNLWKCP